MRGHQAITWLIHTAVLVFVVATLVATHTLAVSACHLPDAPPPICESLECDEQVEARLEQVASSTVPFAQPRASVTRTELPALQLSPIIFQPPEAA